MCIYIHINISNRVITVLSEGFRKFLSVSERNRVAGGLPVFRSCVKRETVLGKIENGTCKHFINGRDAKNFLSCPGFMSHRHLDH